MMEHGDVLKKIRHAAESGATRLDLRDNQLSSLPPEIGQLSQLTTLDLGVNQLSSLPPEIVQLSQLTTLDLSGNRLSSLPPEIGQLSQLTELDLGVNQLSSLPPEIVQLSQLTRLDLVGNQLSSLPPEIGQLSQLTRLDLVGNQLSSLPPEIGQLSQLTTLSLSRNQLSSLPPEIVQLSQLTTLDLSRNQLSSLPPEIVQLSQLTELDLVGNQLSSLPPEIVQLSQLTTLDLRGNRLSSLPPEIGQLSQLTELDLRGNPLPIAPEILGPKELYENPGDVHTILRVYFATQEADATEPLYEAKFLIVGEGGAGKTSLAKKICNPNYALDPDEASTHGIEVIQWRFPTDDGHEFRVNLWDFGGQEIYHQTHQFFLTRRALYALVADDRKENTDFPFWLSSIELFGGDSPVLVIQNQKSDRPCNVNQQQLRGDFPYIKDFYDTNLKTGRGLDDIKAAIRYYISKLDRIGIPLPREWVRVRYALENDARKLIDQRDYFELCQRNGVSDRQEMLSISAFLHELGICLHFQRDPILRHLVILRPDWATNAVYAITTNPDIAENKGRFTRSDVQTIWQQTDYAEMEYELLQLMQNFNLCYPIPGLADHYIAPQLLDFTPPDYTWDSAHNLTLRYEYDFMPKGIITQLIVRLYRWIEQQQLVWRSGAVFNNGRARAEVIETYRPYKGELRIRVSGVHSKELLSIIANEIDQINAAFEKIKVSKKIPCICEECQTDSSPHFFLMKTLDRYLERRRYEITCDKSCLDVNVRELTAVLSPSDARFAPDERAQQERFEQLKHQHVEQYTTQPMPDSKYQIHAQNVQIVENTSGGDAVIHKYANDPNIKTALDSILELLEHLQTQHPNTPPAEAETVLNAELVTIQQEQPSRWQKLQQQFRQLPKDLRNPARLKQASQSALVQVTTDLTDNVFLNALVAFLDGLSDDPDA